MNVLAPLIGTTISLGTVIYHTGKHAYMLENLGFTVNAMEKKDKEYNSLLYDMKTNIGIMNEKLHNIEEDIKEIKSKIK